MFRNKHEAPATETAEAVVAAPRRWWRKCVLAAGTIGMSVALVAGPVTAVTTTAAPEPAASTEQVTVSQEAEEQEANVFGQPLDQAEAASHLGLYERVINVWEADGSNHSFSLRYYQSFYPNAMTFKTMATGASFQGYGESFTLPTGMCAMVSYNDGPWRNRGPGRHYFADGAKVEVDPHWC